MAITTEQIKELREKTGAGILDCRKALEETNGDLKAALDILREKGSQQTQLEQRAERTSQPIRDAQLQLARLPRQPPDKPAAERQERNKRGNRPKRTPAFSPIPDQINHRQTQADGQELVQEAVNLSGFHSTFRFTFGVFIPANNAAKHKRPRQTANHPNHPQDDRQGDAGGRLQPSQG